MQCEVEDCTQDAIETIWVQVGDRYSAFEPKVKQFHICELHYDERVERVYVDMFRGCSIGKR